MGSFFPTNDFSLFEIASYLELQRIKPATVVK